MKSILAATDGSDHADKAVRQAAELAKSLGGDLIIVNVRDDRPVGEVERHFAEVEFGDQLKRYESTSGLAELVATTGLREAVETVNAQSNILSQLISDKILSDAERLAKEAGAKTLEKLSLSGDPADAIVETARKRGADMIVVGHRGIGPVREMLLGSVSQKILHQAPCNVLTVF